MSTYPYMNLCYDIIFVHGISVWTKSVNLTLHNTNCYKRQDYWLNFVGLPFIEMIFCYFNPVLTSVNAYKNVYHLVWMMLVDKTSFEFCVPCCVVCETSY